MAAENGLVSGGLVPAEINHLKTGLDLFSGVYCTRKFL
jgi:hypothetical protein